MISCFLIFLGGVARYQSFLPKIDTGHIGFYNGKELVVAGWVSAEPEESNNMMKVELNGLKISNNNSLVVDGKILVELPRNSDIQYGDEIIFTAKIKKPEDSADFSYSNYLAKSGIYSIAQGIEDFQIIAHNRGSPIIAALYQTKVAFAEKLAKVLPEPHSALAMGLILGVKHGLSDWLVAVFKIIGITHIIAISGYNVSILAKISEGIIGRWSRKWALWGTLLFIASLVIITGAQASIIRAGVMGSLLVVAGLVGRKNNLTNVLVLAGAIMVFLNPLILRDDIGFQLSFLATLGIISLAPAFSLWLKKIPFFFREPLSATLSAQVFTLPILLSSFGVLSLISPLANMIILPIIPLTMLLGFLSGALAFIWLPIGQFFGFFAYAVLDLIIKISEFLARVPYAAVELKINNGWIWGGWYLAIALFLVYRKKKHITAKFLQ